MSSPGPGEAIQRDDYGAKRRHHPQRMSAARGRRPTTVRDAAQITRVAGGEIRIFADVRQSSPPHAG